MYHAAQNAGTLFQSLTLSLSDNNLDEIVCKKTNKKSIVINHSERRYTYRGILQGYCTIGFEERYRENIKQKRKSLSDK